MDEKEVRKVVQARHKIVTDYCKEKNWDIDNLTLAQFLEIRRLPEWINSCRESQK